MQKYHVQPFIKINPNYFSVYFRKFYFDNKPNYYSGIGGSEFKKFDNLENNDNDGTLSKKASKSLTTAINWLTHLSKNQRVWCEELKRNVNFKVNFMTLTLPTEQIKSYTLPCGKVITGKAMNQCFAAANLGFGKLEYYYTDDFIKHDLLNHFFVLLKREFKVHNYVWRAESQKNGNIHFHITMNKFIYLQDVRNLWNRVLSKTDMIQKYHDRFSPMTFEDYKAYRYANGSPKLQDVKNAYEFGVKTNWFQPNTTDIHAVQKIKNLAAYLCSYMTKNNEFFRKIKGFLWRSSALLSKLKSAVAPVTSEVDNEIRYFLEVYKKRIKDSDFCQTFLFSIKDLMYMNKKFNIIKVFQQYRDEIYNQYIKQHQIIL